MVIKLKKICFTCQKEFLRYACERPSKETFCSRDCFYKSRKGKPHNHKTRELKHLIAYPCCYCNSPVYRWRFEVKEGRKFFCGLVCKGKWASLMLINDKACNWKGGKYSTIAKTLCGSRYRRIREMVLVLDNHQCQLCASAERLEAHHILEKGKNPSLIFDINNLITLCKKCHSRIRGKEQEYIGFFDGIVAKRPNSVEPKAKAMAIPSQAELKDSGVCREHGAASKEMICSDTPLKSGD